MTPESTQPLHFLKLLAHDLRWQLVTFLAGSDFRVQELVALLKQPQNLVSYHLKQLREAELVIERRSTADARDIYYSLDLEQMQRLYNAVGLALHPALASGDSIIIRTEQSLSRPVRVLFLCTENSARSQMAEAILREMGGAEIEVFSAGTTPTIVHPDAIQIMADRHIDLRQQRSKSIDQLQQRAFDYVVTVCDRARESCPDFPGDTRRIHWSLSDPAVIQDVDARYAAFAQTAEQLATRIRYLVALIQSEKEVPS